jgi:hypothetical protein
LRWFVPLGVWEQVGPGLVSLRGVVDLPRVNHLVGFEAILCPDEDLWVSVDERGASTSLAILKGRPRTYRWMHSRDPLVNPASRRSFSNSMVYWSRSGHFILRTSSLFQARWSFWESVKVDSNWVMNWVHASTLSSNTNCRSNHSPMCLAHSATIGPWMRVRASAILVW